MVVDQIGITCSQVKIIREAYLTSVTSHLQLMLSRDQVHDVGNVPTEARQAKIHGKRNGHSDAGLIAQYVQARLVFSNSMSHLLRLILYFAYLKPASLARSSSSLA